MQQLLTTNKSACSTTFVIYEAKGEPPTLEELSRNLGLRSIRTGFQYLGFSKTKATFVRRKERVAQHASCANGRRIVGHRLGRGGCQCGMRPIFQSLLKSQA